jgi:hypothetical protein
MNNVADPDCSHDAVDHRLLIDPIAKKTTAVTITEIKQEYRHSVREIFCHCRRWSQLMVSRVVKFFMPIEDAPMRGFNIHGDEVRFMNWSSTS